MIVTNKHEKKEKIMNVNLNTETITQSPLARKTETAFDRTQSSVFDHLEIAEVTTREQAEQEMEIERLEYRLEVKKEKLDKLRKERTELEEKSSHTGEILGMLSLPPFNIIGKMIGKKLDEKAHAEKIAELDEKIAALEQEIINDTADLNEIKRNLNMNMNADTPENLFDKIKRKLCPNEIWGGPHWINDNIQPKPLPWDGKDVQWEAYKN